MTNDEQLIKTMNMKKWVFTALLFFSVIVCHSQAIGRVYFADTPMAVPSDKPDHFEFEASKSDLSDAGKEYLQYMLDQYGNSITIKTGARIIIEPAAGGGKAESEKIAMKRVQTIEKFLNKTKVKPHKTNYKSQVITIQLGSSREKA